MSDGKYVFSGQNNVKNNINILINYHNTTIIQTGPHKYTVGTVVQIICDFVRSDNCDLPRKIMEEFSSILQNDLYIISHNTKIVWPIV